MLASAISRTLGRPSLAIDYLSWDPLRVHATRLYIPLQGYDDFDIWWLRPLNSGNWVMALLIGLFLGFLFAWSFRSFYRAYINFEGV